MLLYQLDNSRSLWHVQIDLYRDFAYVPHLHRDFEFVYVLSGELEVSVAERRERAQAGDLALVLPNQVHAYRTPAASQALVCVFSGDYVSAFQREMEGCAGERSVFACPAALDGYLREGFLGVDGPDKFTLMAALYAVCAQYKRAVPAASAPRRSDELLVRLMRYVEENYREDISMKQAARALGYSENYLSRAFHTAVGMNFRQYVNQYRVQLACRLIEQRRGSMTRIAMESGFQNIRSFNRAFMRATGRTPSHYGSGEFRT